MKRRSPENELIKKEVNKILQEQGASTKKIILFGSRARKDFTPLSDYDLLIITDEPFDINKKMSISKRIRQYLAHSDVDVDVIIKSKDEVEKMNHKSS